MPKEVSSIRSRLSYQQPNALNCVISFYTVKQQACLTSSGQTANNCNMQEVAKLLYYVNNKLIPIMLCSGIVTVELFMCSELESCVLCPSLVSNDTA